MKKAKQSSTEVAKNTEIDKKKQMNDIINSIQAELDDIDVETIEKDLILVKAFDPIEVEKTTSDEAKKFLTEIALQYSTKEEFFKDPFLKSKIREDLNILSELKYQAKISRFVSMKLLENISSDQLYFKNYEAMKGVQQSVLDIIKHIVQLESLMEDYYRVYFAKKGRTKNVDKNDISNSTGYILTPEQIITQLEGKNSE